MLLEKRFSSKITFIVAVIAFVWLSAMLLVAMIESLVPSGEIASCSMTHNPLDSIFCGEPANIICDKTIDVSGWNFDKYWEACKDGYESTNISKERFRSFDFSNGIRKGDLVIIDFTHFGDLKEGDVVVIFKSNSSAERRMVHRLVKVNQDYTFETKGDTNILQWDFEQNITPNRIYGKVVFAIPQIAWPTILTCSKTRLPLLCSTNYFEPPQKVVSLIFPSNAAD